ncbi:hypothetical protein BCR41DRAFT_369530 [Lobosporangium transversale]|uniref:Uncharacterized protein n=1 Tax=Lobosporangium transversale TaxID=64571 RepID=A0A1Y2GS22_9FUNG|nr:hypothetical protein BCR41DRAFT_369530 [Lobosporangium transversale]ORZ20931.1 hypothetical protein BCR41DRAFT_369530 [Lobosporangium transversale]|eukprot:XP_021882840.1 hypothetical protein BCR41DRAFT_369530 [Lobosporangium transversale]
MDCCERGAKIEGDPPPSEAGAVGDVGADCVKALKLAKEREIDIREHANPLVALCIYIYILSNRNRACTGRHCHALITDLILGVAVVTINIFAVIIIIAVVIIGIIKIITGIGITDSVIGISDVGISIGSVVINIRMSRFGHWHYRH